MCGLLQKSKASIKLRFKRAYYKQKVKTNSQVMRQGPVVKVFQGITDKILPQQSKYRLPSEKITREILDRTTVDELKYLSETWDCDAFAGLLHLVFRFNYRITGIAKVLNYEGGHSFNTVITPKALENPEEGLLVIEPQSDEAWEFEVNKKKGTQYTIEGQAIFI